MYELGECMYDTLCYPRQDELRAATPFSHPSVVTDQSTRRRGFRPPSGGRTPLTKVSTLAPSTIHTRRSQRCVSSEPRPCYTWWEVCGSCVQPQGYEDCSIQRARDKQTACVDGRRSVQTGQASESVQGGSDETSRGDKSTSPRCA